MQPKSHLSLLALAIQLLPSAQAVAWHPGKPTAATPWTPEVSVGAAIDTTSGTIIGHTAQNYSDVSEYLGIPFAQPPLGQLRFAPPQPFNGNAPIVADKQPLSCVQAPSTINYSQPVNWQNIAANKASFSSVSSEDCLYLNVWSKASTKRNDLKPVMIWFFGGGFHSGGASDNTEQGSLFVAEQDVVMVNFNYRLGIFGFSGAPGQTQNVGLLDQRLAIEWVRDNIQAFGGDPDRIIIFGHSAGGAGVDLYDYAWLSDPIITGTIAMSGTATSFGNRLPNTTAAGWYETASLIGCGSLNTTSDAAILSCMRSEDSQALFSASTNASKVVEATLDTAGKTYAGITGLFGPTIDNQTVFMNYTLQGELGLFVQKPVIVGNNIDEGCFFAEEGQIPVSDEPFITELVFTCPVSWDAIRRAAKGLNVWKYSYVGAWPNMYAPDCPGKPWHGQEVDVLFGSTVLATEQAATAQELRVGAYMRSAFAAFARNPNSGVGAFGWPTFGSNESNVVQLGLNGTQVEAVVSAVDVDADCFSNFTQGAPNF